MGVTRNSHSGVDKKYPKCPIRVYCPPMRKNLASVVILGATMALSLTVVSPALAAAQYPPTIGKVILDNTSFVVGVPKGVVKTYLGNADVLAATYTIKKNVTEVLAVRNLGKGHAGEKVATTIKNPDGSTTKIPDLVIDAKGNIKSDGIAFKKPGVYKVSFKLPNGKTKITTFVVSK